MNQSPFKLIALVSLLVACGANEAAPAGAGASVSVDGGGGTPTGSGGTTGNGGTTPSDGGVPNGGTGPSTSASRLTAVQLGGSSTAPNGYYEYLPPDYDQTSPSPLIVYWHGLGADGNGTDGLYKVATEGLARVINDSEWPDVRPFIVLAPQHQPNGGNIAPGEGCPSGPEVDTFITWALSNYNIDAKKVFLTGLSCGAIGSWDYLAEHRDVVAAAVLIAGNPGDPTQASSTWQRAGGCDLGAVAVWSLHGDKDDTVPFAPDSDTMGKLIACPNPPRRNARFTPLAGAGHNIWDGIYDLTANHGDIYQWMLDNAKP
jgi:predicted peptidase